MKLVTMQGPDNRPRLGVLRGESVLDVARLGEAFGNALPGSMADLIDAGAPGLAALREAVLRHAAQPAATPETPLARTRLLAPIPRPRNAIVGVGLNYRAHAAEGTVAAPDKPVIFFKPASTVIGPGAPILHDRAMTRQLDWEVELAVIIGRTARRVPLARALDHVFGYSVMIDITARDNLRAGQMDLCKGMDSYGPFGPCIVTADEIPDPQALTLWLSVNGLDKQRGTTAEMIFGVDALIADISAALTLSPGDIIATGTPGGVGAGRTPPEWLWPGDRVEAGIEGIGTLSHPVIDDTPGAGSAGVGSA